AAPARRRARPRRRGQQRPDRAAGRRARARRGSLVLGGRAAAATRFPRPAARRGRLRLCRLAPRPSCCSRPRPSLSSSPTGSPVLTIHLFIPMDPAEYRAHAAVDEDAVLAFLRYYADVCVAHGVTPLIENVPPVLRMRTGGVFLSPVGGHWEDLLAWRARVPEVGFTIDTSHAALFRSFAAAYPSLFGLESDEGLELERYVEELGPAA